MHLHRIKLETELRHRGALRAKEMASFLGVSQPTVSRLLSGYTDGRIVRLGCGKSTRYAITRELSSLGSSWPLYTIDEKGRPQLVGQLHAMGGRQWCLQQDSPWDSLRGNDFPDGLYPGFPWFLDDLRPQGFLGRLFARTYGNNLGLPTDPRDWQADDVILSLLRHGEDLPGSFILGDAMLSGFQARKLTDTNQVSAETRLAVYPTFADSILGGEWTGSSAAGEQPKFTAIIHHGAEGISRHVIVKFSGRAGRPEDVRWGDLLTAEHYAATLLNENGIPAAQTALLASGGRRFLESTRFDRIGLHGRRGLVTLTALDSAFFGQLQTPWTAAASRLQNAGWLTTQDANQLKLLWWFGTLIGNTDMHYGNASLFLEPRRPVALAPAYDMLPMLYRPDPEGALPDRLFAPPPPPPEALPAWTQASAMAETFWMRLASAPMISPSFQKIAAVNSEIIAHHRRQFLHE